MSYPFQEIQNKWQAQWESNGEFNAPDQSEKPKFYALIEFPYPSAEGLHVGHPRSYVAMDVVARKRRMEGYNVLYPIGWDAFGLPAENHAIKTGIHPRISTEQNIANFKRQLKALGLSFDWSREINTTDPAFYKWTQWIFLRLFERGLAYKAEMPINWCTSCKVGLANEEVVAGVCERCGADVIRKKKNQWLLRITKYADRLIEDLKTVDYLDRIATQQINWIGRSYGAEIRFSIPDADITLPVFTTRPDTVFGATYMVLSPEHPVIEQLQERITNYDEVAAYCQKAAGKSDLERTDLAKHKSGVELKGIAALNPATSENIPIWISDYVLMTYGTGCIMAVPAHDQRDYEFAKTYDLPIRQVVAGGSIEEEAYTDIQGGTMINSGILDGQSVKEAIATITDWLVQKDLGAKQVNYKLRDWVFSRQRYWGEPIPIVHCPACGTVALPEEELPLILPEMEDFIASDEGESLLAKLPDWVQTQCPRCDGEASRETDTMPQWAGSSWYFLRYIDPHNDQAFAAEDKLKQWSPVNWYNGGMEHTTLHLLYSRFWHKFLYDEGLLPTSEPYLKRTSHGMILGEDNEKMSKSRGNVVNPDEVMQSYGADTFRVYEMFIGAFDQASQWSTEGINGVHRFLSRVWSTLQKFDTQAPLQEDQRKRMHKAIKRVGDRIESMKFNTAVAELMSLTNELLLMPKIPAALMETLCLLLNPFAPHLTSEMWSRCFADKEPPNRQPWPQYDAELARDETVVIAVQINGKLRATIDAERDCAKDPLIETVKQLPKIKKFTDGKTIRKVIHVPNKIVNIVTG